MYFNVTRRPSDKNAATRECVMMGYSNVPGGFSIGLQNHFYNINTGQIISQSGNTYWYDVKCCIKLPYVCESAGITTDLPTASTTCTYQYSSYYEWVSSTESTDLLNPQYSTSESPLQNPDSFTDTITDWKSYYLQLNRCNDGGNMAEDDANSFIGFVTASGILFTLSFVLFWWCISDQYQIEFWSSPIQAAGVSL